MIAVMAAGVFGFGTAHASVTNCPLSSITEPTAKVEDSTGTISATSACQYITPAASNNVASIANINAANFFGTSSWSLNGANLQVAPSNGQTGTWAISNYNFALYDYIIVFKDGADTNLIAFLFNEQFSSGVWSTPFTNPPFNVKNAKDVSHYTIAQRVSTEIPCTANCGPQEVPEPGNAALFGIGILGAAVALHRRRQH